MMKRCATLLAMSALALAATASTGCIVLHEAHVRGSGTIVSETRELAGTGFDRVESRGSADLTIVLGEPSSVTIEADDNLLPKITTEVSDGVLVVAQEGNLSSKHGIKVQVTMPALAGVTIKGAGDVEIPEVHGETFDVSLNGSGDVRAAGAVDRVGVAIRGSGDIDLAGLVSKSASVSIAGSGDVRLHVTDELNASIAGSGNIRYAGDPPTVRKRVAGSGDIGPA